MELNDLDQRRADSRVQTVCLLILTFIAGAVALYLLKPVLVPFVLALFFTYCLSPVIGVLAHLAIMRGEKPKSLVMEMATES